MRGTADAVERAQPKAAATGPAPGAERAATARGPPLTWPGSPSPSAGPPASWPGSWRRPHWPSSGPAAPCGLAPGSRGWQTRLVAGRQPPQPQPPERPTPGPGSREAGTAQPSTGSPVQERACSVCFPTASSCDGTGVSSRNFKRRVLARIPTSLGLLFRWHSVLAASAHHAPSRRLGVGLQLDLDGSRCAERRQGPAPTPSADVCTPLSRTLTVSTLSVPVSLEPVLPCTEHLAGPVSTRPRGEGSGAPWPRTRLGPGIGLGPDPLAMGASSSASGHTAVPQAKDLAGEGDHCCTGEHMLPSPGPTAPCS